MVRINLTYLLCECESLDDVESTARELGCVDLRVKAGALHLTLPTGDRGSLRPRRDGGKGFVWCGVDDAE